MATATPSSIDAEVEYPDSDGKSMSDHDLQYKWIVIFKEGLVVQFDRDPDVYVGANLLWYPVQGKPKLRGAPDVLVTFGRPKGLRGSYRQWEEGGIAPQVVFEVLSPGNRPGQMRRKFQFYQRHGVEEYYVYDPFRGSLEGWLRRGRRLVKVARMRGFVSPLLGIRFESGVGPDNLTVIGRDGGPFLAPVQISRQLDAERQRAAEVERLRAEERQRAAEADERAARCAAKLRELGIEPD
jgi:Uma2 family endonuclease